MAKILTHRQRLPTGQAGSGHERKVAIFDVDGTIFRSSLFIELTEALINAGIFPAKIRKLYTNEHLLWLDRKGSYEDYIMAMVRVYEKYLVGVKSADFNRVANQVVKIHRNRVYRYTRDLIKQLKVKGYFLLAISQSPKSILDLFCKELGFDLVYGRRYEVDGYKKFTGKVLDLDVIADKAAVLERASQRYNLTLKGSIGVGDTEGDISMLSRVDHPICFNPNKALYDRAKKKGWKIVVERKDVIHLI